jgi:putative membrane protein
MKKRDSKDYLLLVARGAGMGAADVIPGVSGGTIAFITGIYQELINSIKSINRDLFLVMKDKGFAAAWKHLNGWFLLAVFSGIIISILSLARLITWLIDIYPKMVWAFFFGLIIASAIHVARKIDIWKADTVASLIAGIAIAAYITIAAPATTPESLWFIFLSGAIAICAMILPGISGSFILLLLGKYEFMLNAVRNLDLTVISVFAVGCVVGIISFSNVISWLFRKIPNATMALLTGFMIGSLNKLWPWKEILSYRFNSAGEQVPFLEKSISPYRYQEIYGDNPMVWHVLGFAIAGFLVIFLFDVITDVKARKEKTV